MKNKYLVEWDCGSCKARATRREFIIGMGGLAAAALLREEKLLAQTTPFRIDVHHHYAAPEFQAEMTKRNAGNPNYRNWVPKVSLDEMDKSAVATSMLSVTRPGVWFGDVALAKRLARVCNDFGAKLVRDYPGRFGLFAVLPLPDVDGSLKEIAYAYDTLKCDGVAVMSNYDDIYLGDPRIAPVMDELNRRKAIVYEHPVREDRDNPLNGIELITETTRSIASVLYNGTVTRCPDIRFIWAHGGGTVAAASNRMGGTAAKLPKGLMYELQRFYYDTGQAQAKPILQSLKALVPVSQILFGTDFPLIAAGGILNTAKGIRENGGFTEAELRAIDRENALKLFPRLKT
jgi:6-methylsalicylate decarboxylase